MPAVVGVFKSQSEADLGARKLVAAGISEDKINLLTPHASAKANAAETESVPRTMGEQPGMVKAIGAVAGGAVGLGIGEGLATLLIPGVGPVLAIGLAGGALLGALAGGAVAGAGEDAIFSGLPEEELYVYKDALKHQRTVLIASAKDKNQAEVAKSALAAAGAESIDRAREMWWLGLRDVEKEHYEADGGNFETDERTFREGFRAALETENRGKTYENCSARLRDRFPDSWEKEPFRRGFERGQKYCEAQSKGNQSR